MVFQFLILHTLYGDCNSKQQPRAQLLTAADTWSETVSTPQNSTQAGAIERGLPGPIRRVREGNAQHVLKRLPMFWRNSGISGLTNCLGELIRESSESSLIEGLGPTKSPRRAPSVGGLNRGRRQNFAAHLFASGRSHSKPNGGHRPWCLWRIPRGAVRDLSFFCHAWVYSPRFNEDQSSHGTRYCIHQL